MGSNVFQGCKATTDEEEGLVISCEFAEKPAAWKNNWAPANVKVVWLKAENAD